MRKSTGFRLLLLTAALLAAGAASLPAQGVPKFDLARGPLELKGGVQSYRFLNAVGEKSGVWGYENGRFEAWVYPLKIFRDFHLVFQMEGWPRMHDGSGIVRSVRVYPHMVQLVYVTERFAVTQTIFAPRSEPGAVMLLDVRAPAPLRIFAKFRPELDLMWPAGIGGQSSSWSEEDRWIRLSEASGRFAALVGSPAASASTAIGYNPYLTDRQPHEVLELRVTPEQAEASFIPIVVAATVPGHYEAEAAYERILNNIPELHAGALERFTELEESGTEFITPAPRFNESMRWARVALEQLRICNPHLGCSYVAGYGSSGTGTRPMYAWFFDEPAIGLWAMLDYGGREAVKTAYRFIKKYSREDGKVMHEAPQSAAYIDWFEDYPYAYIHQDSPVWNINAMAHYFRFTGDEEFVRESWPFVRKAYEYTVSVTDPADGLPQIPEGEWASMESGEFSKDAALSAAWVAALRNIQELAAFMGEDELAAGAKRREEQAAESLEKFWNPETRYYNYGFDAEGEPLTNLNPIIGYSAWYGSLPENRARAVLEKLSNAAFLADWGQRNMSMEDPRYTEGSYHVGSVWPFMTAGPLLGQYKHRRALTGFQIWTAMNHLRHLNARGFMPEVLSGHAYRLLDRAVPHQMFSEHNIIPGYVQGILGLELHVPERTLLWAPQLPPHWPSAALRRFPYGDEKLDIEIQNRPGEMTAVIEKSSAEPLDLTFAPALPAGSRVESVAVNGEAVEFDVVENAMDVQAKTELSLAGRARIVIRYEPGVAVEIPWTRLLEGESSRNLRVIRARYDGAAGELRLLVEGLPGRDYEVRLHTPWRAASAESATVEKQHEDRITLRLQAPASAETGPAGYARWEVAAKLGE